MREMKLPVHGHLYLVAACVLLTATQHGASNLQDKNSSTTRSKRHTTLEDIAQASSFQQGVSELVFSNQTGAVLPCLAAGELKRALIAAGERLTGPHPADISLAASGSQDDEQLSTPARLDKLPAGLQVRWERDNGEPIQQLLATDRSLLSASQPEEGRPIRWQRSSDGALVFEPFRAHEFRPDLHLTGYRCVASFAGGAMRGTASLMGQETRVRALVQGSAPFLQAEVLDELVLEGSSAHFRCQVPSQARDLLHVLEWIEYPSETRFTAASTTRSYISAHLSSASANNHTAPGSALSTGMSFNQAARYFVDPLTGDLHILNVDSSFSFRAYKCTCRHRITGELVSSTNRGKLIVTESHSPVGPRPSGLESARAAVRLEGDLALLSCDVQAYPRAHFTWWRRVNELELEPVDLSGAAGAPRTIQLANLLIIERLYRNLSGTYVCSAKNSAGEERLEQDLVIRAPLKASLSSSAKVLELGKSLALECTVSGFPIHQMVFRHNLNIIKSIRATKVASQQPSYFVVDERPEGGSDISSSLLSSSSAASGQPQSTLGGPQNNNNNNQEDKLSHAIVILLEPERAGAYQCFAYNQYESAEASTYIRILDDPPKFKETFRGELVEPGSGLSLRCSARANPLPEITWSVDEEPLPEGRVRFGDFVTKDGLVVSYVNISQTQPIDGGLYRCTADNGLAQVAHQALIQVRGVPQVKPMPNITVLASSRLRYRCPAVGYPLGEIHWLHNGRRLPANHRQHVHENGTLEVEHMERSQLDQGEYVCLVHAPAGGSQPTDAASPSSSQQQQQQRMSAAYLAETGPARGSLFVSIKARPVIEPFSFSRALQEGQRASITCTISSGDLPITFEWLHNGRPIVADSGSSRQQDSTASGSVQAPQVGSSLAASSSSISGNLAADQQNLGGLRLSQATEYSTTLLFESLVVQHSGNYTCVAHNDAGSVSHQALMTVQVAPKWSFEPADTNVVRGASMSINCMASGFPPPRIIWTKASGGASSGDSGFPASSAHKSVPQLPASWRSIVSSPHLQVYENGSLNILDARDSDVGYYMCQASNGVGPGLSKVIQVMVNVAAQFGSRQGVQHARRADSASLKCLATGDAPLQIYWFKNRHRLEAVNELQIAATGGSLEPASLMGGPGGAPEQLSATQAAVLLRTPVPGLSGISGHHLASPHLASSAKSTLSGNTWARASGYSPLEQLEALLSAAPKQQGLLLERYSLVNIELLPFQSHRLEPMVSLQGAKQRFELLKTLRGSSGVHKHQQQQQLLQQQPLLIQVSSILTISQTDRQDTAAFKCVAANHFGVDERTVQLVVQEAPSNVEELSVLEVSSRTITLGWYAPFDGNSPILSYRIQSRSENDSLDQGWTNHTVIMSNGVSTSTNDSALALISHLDETGTTEGAGLVYQGAGSRSTVMNQQQPGTRSPIKQSVVALKPQTHYWFRVAAENRFGLGPLSNAIEAITQDEAPGAAPTKLRAVPQSSSSLLISWQRPNEKEIFGPVVGYHIAYKALPSEQQPPKSATLAANSSSEPQTNTYKSVQHDNKLSKFDALLTNLRKSTSYMISVQAFNNRGTGPATEPIVVRTLDIDPPRQLKLFVRQTTNCSIQIEWRPLSQVALMYQQQQQQQHHHHQQQQQHEQQQSHDSISSKSLLAAGEQQHSDYDQVDYYSLYLAELNGQPQWSEIRLPGHATSHNIDGLRCGTRYQFYMMGANKIGLGDQSDILETKTAGGSPLPPDIQSAFDVINATCYIIRLDRWQDTGCPIRGFNLRYKPSSSSEFQQLAQYQLLPATDSEPRETGDPSQVKPEAMQRRRVQRSSDYSGFTYGPEMDTEEPLVDYSLKDYIMDSKLALLGPPSVEPGGQLFNFLKDSMQPIHVLDSSNELGPTTSKWYQQQQESVLEQPTDWRKVRFCGLVEGMVYTVRIVASSSVGETEEDYNILASPEGLKNDPANQRQVVGKLGPRDNRMADSYNLSINGSLFALSQWPVLIPLLMTLAMLAIIMLGALLLRRSNPPGSSSSITTTSGVPECQQGFLADRISFNTNCQGNGTGPAGLSGPRHGELVFSGDGYGPHPIYQQQNSRVPNMYDESPAYGMLDHQSAPGQANGNSDPSSNRSTSSPATTTTANTSNSIHSASHLVEPQSSVMGSSVHLRGSSGGPNSSLNIATKPAQSVYMCGPQKADVVASGGGAIKELFYGTGSQQAQSVYQPSHQVVQVKHYQPPQGQPLNELSEVNSEKQNYFQTPMAEIYGHRETVAGHEKPEGSCFMSLVEEVARANDAIQQQTSANNIKQDQTLIEQVTANKLTACSQPHCMGQHFAEASQQSCQNYALVSGGHHTAADGKPGGDGARLSYDPVYATIRRTFPQAFRYLTLQHQQVAEQQGYCPRNSLEEGSNLAQRLFSSSNGQLVHDLAHLGSNNFNSLDLANGINSHNQAPQQLND